MICLLLTATRNIVVDVECWLSMFRFPSLSFSLFFLFFDFSVFCLIGSWVFFATIFASTYHVCLYFVVLPLSLTVLSFCMCICLTNSPHFLFLSYNLHGLFFSCFVSLFSIVNVLYCFLTFCPLYHESFGVYISVYNCTDHVTQNIAREPCGEQYFVSRQQMLSSPGLVRKLEWKGEVMLTLPLLQY